jgi:DNA-binding NarL/FixJ family response regulator
VEEASVPTPTIPQVATVAVVTPHDIVAVGLRTMLAQIGPSLRLVDAEPQEPDVLLYDVVALIDGDTSDLDHWVKETASTVVALTRPLRPDLGALALDRGAEAVVPLDASAEEIVGVALSAAAGTLDDSEVARAAEHDTRLGEVVGLSPRETDVLRLVVLGFSNHEIARELFVSVNSVKTYIRSAYRKIGVTTRAQVVSWCVRHGFPPATG